MELHLTLKVALYHLTPRIIVVGKSHIVCLVTYGRKFGVHVSHLATKEILFHEDLGRLFPKLTAYYEERRVVMLRARPKNYTVHRIGRDEDESIDTIS